MSDLVCETAGGKCLNLPHLAATIRQRRHTATLRCLLPHGSDYRHDWILNGCDDQWFPQRDRQPVGIINLQSVLLIERDDRKTPARLYSPAREDKPGIVTRTQYAR